MLSEPFQVAERYITLKKRCAPESWGDMVLYFNEMVLGPLVAVFLAFMGSQDFLMLFSAITRSYSAWNDWEEYHSLRSEVQGMFLTMMLHGGPKITTNDTTYLPYVFADAVVRLGAHHQPPRWDLQQEVLRHMPHIPHMSELLAYLQ